MAPDSGHGARPCGQAVITPPEVELLPCPPPSPRGETLQAPRSCLFPASGVVFILQRRDGGKTRRRQPGLKSQRGRVAAAGFAPGMLWGCGVKKEGTSPSPGLVPLLWGHLLVPLSLRGHQAAGGWHSTLCSLPTQGFSGKLFQPRSQTLFPWGLRRAGELRQPDGLEVAADSQIPPRACGSHI